MSVDGSRRVRRKVSLTCPEKGRTHQSFQEECDINTIMRKYQPGVPFGHVAGGMASYGDFSDVTDFKTALDRLNAAEALFMDLPPAVRSRVDNDPGKFIDFVMDGKNQEECEQLGLFDVPPGKSSAEVLEELVDEFKKASVPTPEKGPESPVQGG